MSTYNPADYKVLSTYTGGLFKEDILNGATISIKGAVFKIERVYTHQGKPTRIFEFLSLNEWVDDDTSKELIEIGWSHCIAGMDKIGKELGLTYHNGPSAFSLSTQKPYFVEEVA